MRIAPLVMAGLVSVSCGGRTAEVPEPAAHRLAGSWSLRSLEVRTGLLIEMRVDSVARDSAYGRLTHYMAGNAGFLAPDDWGPLVGTVRADTVRLLVMRTARAPELGFAGRLDGDTIHLAATWIAMDTIPTPTVLVRLP